MFYHDDDKTNDYIAEQVEEMIFDPAKVADACDYTDFFTDLSAMLSADCFEERVEAMHDLRDKIALRLAKVMTLPNGELALQAKAVVDTGSEE